MLGITWAADNKLIVAPVPFVSGVIAAVIFCSLFQIYYGKRIVKAVRETLAKSSALNVVFVFSYIALLLFHTLKYLAAFKEGRTVFFWGYLCRMMSDIIILLISHAWIYFVGHIHDIGFEGLERIIPDDNFAEHYLELKNRLHWDRSKNTWYFNIYAFLWWGSWFIWMSFLFVLNVHHADYKDPAAIWGFFITLIMIGAAMALNCESYFISFMQTYFFHSLLSNNAGYLFYPYNRSMPSATVSINKMIQSVTTGARCFLFTTMLYTVSVGLILTPYAIEAGNADSYRWTEVSIQLDGFDKIQQPLTDVGIFYFVALLVFVGLISFLVIYHLPKIYISRIHRGWVMQELGRLPQNEEDHYQRAKQLCEDKLNMPKTYEVYLLSILTFTLQVLQLVFTFFRNGQ